MKALIFNLLTLLSVVGFAQNLPENNSVDFTAQIKALDISDLWTTSSLKDVEDYTYFKRPEPLGFIGENYLRLKIHIISAIKSPENPLVYLIYGKSNVKDNICTFQGIIRVEKAQTYVTGDLPDYKQGFVTGHYSLYEDPDQRGTGTFQGEFRSEFFIDTDGRVEYNTLEYAADGFSNNQFIGTWKGYNSGLSKPCNWGDFRIPNSGLLDQGAGEFVPAEKYFAYGWQSYSTAWFEIDDETKSEQAQKEENMKWWIEQN